MATKSSFANMSSMFNRLPLYTRPKEPSIGAPVLTQSTNERLSGKPVAMIGPDGRPMPTISMRSQANASTPDLAKTLPQIPTDDFNVTIGRAYTEMHPLSRPENRLETRPESRPTTDQRRHNVIRKPAPSGSITGESSERSETSRCDDKGKTAATIFGTMVKGARRGKPAAKPEADSPALIKPFGLNSIDDWLDSRERLHQRSPTGSTTSSKEDKDKLHLRQSTFAPLQPGMKPDPTPPPPPKHSQIPLPVRGSSLAQTTMSPSPRVAFRAPPSPPPISRPDKPLDHIGELEWEQSQLENRKDAIRKQIREVEQQLPANPATKEGYQMRAMLDELNQKYADVEKSHHDLGLRLYRAYRRKDKREGVEGPTHLWISRVTAPLED